MPLAHRRWFSQLKSTVPQMQCNCSETQEKRGLVCTAILFSLMWFITAFENVFKIYIIALAPQSPILTTVDPCVVYSYSCHLPSTLSLLAGLKLGAQNFKSSPRTSTMCVRGKCNCLSWYEYSLQSKYTRKCAVYICVWSILACGGTMQGLEPFLWKLNLLFDCRSETFLQ